MRVILSYLFLLCVFLFKDISCRSHRHRSDFRDGKIVGGYNATIENFPYQALLIVQKGADYYQCGGSIIDKYTVLTAAHCLNNITQGYIRTGSDKSGSGGALSISYNFKQHPKYNPQTSDYDVGIIKPLIPINIDGVKTKAVRLAQRGSNVSPGTQLLVSGWGTTSENGDTSDNLMAVEVPTVAFDQCRQKYSSLTDRMICAGVPEGGKDSCQGDSGGPAVAKSSGVQVGIVSFGVGCAREGYPGVYTNVGNAGVRDWIQKVSGK